VRADLATMTDDRDVAEGEADDLRAQLATAQDNLAGVRLSLSDAEDDNTRLRDGLASGDACLVGYASALSDVVQSMQLSIYAANAYLQRANDTLEGVQGDCRDFMAIARG